MEGIKDKERGGMEGRKDEERGRKGEEERITEERKASNKVTREYLTV